MGLLVVEELGTKTLSMNGKRKEGSGGQSIEIEKACGQKGVQQARIEKEERA